VDTVIRTERKRRPGSSVTLIKNQQPHGKQKDAAEFEDIALYSTKVEFDYRGERASTLVLMRDERVVGEGEEAPARSASAKPQGANQHAVMKALRQAKGAELGLMRLSQMIAKTTSDTLKAVRPLVEKGLVQEIGEEGAQRWVLP
jgi:hypothetical protein